MGIVNVSYGIPAGPVPMFPAVPDAAESITSGVASTAGTATASSANQSVRVSTDTKVWIKFGAAPTAAAGSDHLMAAGTMEYFSGLQSGFKLAVIDA